MMLKVTVSRVNGDTVSHVAAYELVEFLDNLIQMESDRITKVTIEPGD